MLYKAFKGILIFGIFCFSFSLLYGSEESPWGTVAVFPTKFTELPSYGGDDCVLDETKWRPYYYPVLKTMKRAGISWNRANCAPGAIPLDENYFEWGRSDSLVVYMQELDLNLLSGCGPPGWFPWSDNPLKWAEVCIETINRYDGEDDGFTMPGLTKPIKYWNLCNEPCFFSSYYKSPEKGTIERLHYYLKVCANAVHSADPEAKVVAPSVMPWQEFWNDEGGFHFLDPYDFWKGMLDKGGKDFLDIISANYFTVNPDNPGENLWTLGDKYGLRSFLDNLGAPDKKIWATEMGYWNTIPGARPHFGYSNEQQAEMYKSFFETWLANRDWLDKAFIFTLTNGDKSLDDIDLIRGQVAGNAGVFENNLINKFSADTLMKYTYFTSEQNNSTTYNNQRKLIMDEYDRLHLVSSTYGDIRYAMSNDGGTKWATTWTFGSGNSPALALDKSESPKPIICWVGEEDGKSVLYYQNSGVPEILDPEPDPAPAGYMSPPPLPYKLYEDEFLRISAPSIAIDDDNNVHIAFGVGVVPSIEGDGGESPNFEPPYSYKVFYKTFPVNSPDTDFPNEIDSYLALAPSSLPKPSIDLDRSQKPHIVYSFQHTDNPTVYYAFKEGNEWTTSIISTGSNPSLEIWDGNRAHIVWEDNNDIYYTGKLLTPRGTTNWMWWMRIPTNISNSIKKSRYPVIVGGSQILWQEETHNGVYQINYSCFTGTNWENPGDIDNIIGGNINEYFPQVSIEPHNQFVMNGLLATLHYTYTYGQEAPYRIQYGTKNVIMPRLTSGEIIDDMIYGCNTYITGDLTVDSGVTLTIEPGVTMYFCPSDDQNSGQDTTVPEIEVYGTLIADSAQFIISTENGKQYWRVETFGADASATFTDCSIGHEGDLLFCSNTGSISPQVNEERLVYTDNTDKVDLAMPKVFKFSQNEPNPFFKSTIIKYQLPTKSKVSLRIYDITGRCVKTLIDNEKEIGYYTVKWDSKEFSAGIYFMKFFAKDGTEKVYKETKKLILLK